MILFTFTTIFDVTIQKLGKIANSYLPSEIYCLDQTISIDGLQA